MCQQVEWLLLVLHYGLALALELSATLPLKSLKACGPDASSSLAEVTVGFFPLPVTSSVSQYQTNSFCCSCCCFLHYMPSAFSSRLVSLFFFFFLTPLPSPLILSHKVKKAPSPNKQIFPFLFCMGFS